MFLVGMLTWWYGDGWRQRMALFRDRIARSSDYFSLGLLITTFFAPYRQISAGSVSGPVALQLRAFFDKTISRVIGAIIRLFVLLFGCAVIALQALFGAVVIVSWMLIPFLPIVGMIVAILGWTPSWR